MKRTLIAAAAAVAVLTAGGAAWAVTRPDADTPCQAATTIVTDVRVKAQAGNGDVVAYMGGTYGSMLRRIVSGEWEDVKGPVSPQLRAALYALATDLETLKGGDHSAAGFTTGETGRHIDAVIAACQ